jgi:hypothetical protein
MSLPVPALVLRRVPAERLHLVHALLRDPPEGVDGTWWELVDVATPPGEPATGVALTCTGPDGVARVVALAAVGTPDDDPKPRLLLELVAALRRTDAVGVELRCPRPDAVTELLTELLGDDVECSGDLALVRF